jgi:hypothetical protein
MPNLQEVPNIGDRVAQLAVMTDTLNQMIRGRGNNVGTFTLTPSVGSTTISDNLFAYDSVPLIIATTANAAAEIGNGTIYLSARANGSFTFTHANNVQADRTFLYARIG